MDPHNPYAAPQASLEQQIAEAGPKPFSLTNALYDGTSVYVRRFPEAAAITLTIAVPLNVFLAYMEYFVLYPNDVFAVVRWTMAADAFVGVIIVGGLVSLGAAELRGKRRGWLAALGDGFAAWPVIFATRFVAGLITLAGLCLFVLPAIYLGVRYLLADCVAVLERRAGMNALNRSMSMTRGRFFTFLGLGLLTLLPGVVVSFVLFLPLGLFPQLDHWLISAALTCVVELVDAWMTLVVIAAYVQCREQENAAQTPVAITVPGGM